MCARSHTNTQTHTRRRIGLLVDRRAGTMRVFFNGHEHSNVISGIPKKGEVYFMTELLAAPQRLRLIPRATPPALK